MQHERGWVCLCRLRQATLLLLALALLLPVSAYARSDVTLDVIPLFQADYPDALFTLNGQERSVATSGCGAVCLAMAMAYLNPAQAQAPGTLLTWAYENGRYHGLGLSCQTLTAILEAYGYTGKWIGTAPKGLRQALKDGHPAIAAMGPGHFTENGHYILIYGIDPKDRVRVIDPNSPEKSKQMYDLQMIFDEIKGSQAFLICGFGEAE